MSRRIGVCSKCFKIRRLQRHHCCPVRFFGKKNNKSTLWLCGECHYIADRLFPYRKKLTQEVYLAIHKEWIRED